MIDGISEEECEVSWQAAKPLPGGSMQYRLQLSQHTSLSSADYKQVGSPTLCSSLFK